MCFVTEMMPQKSHNWLGQKIKFSSFYQTNKSIKSCAKKVITGVLSIFGNNA